MSEDLPKNVTNAIKQLDPFTAIRRMNGQRKVAERKVARIQVLIEQYEEILTKLPEDHFFRIEVTKMLNTFKDALQ